jgi:pyridoxamine 5'-phosphate oxidase family protein
MSVFTPQEIEFLQSQRLGRLATVNPGGRPQNAPVGFRYNPELDTIEIGGRFMSQSKKFRNIQQNPYVAFVVDDVLPPWKPRGWRSAAKPKPCPRAGGPFLGLPTTPTTA